MFNIILLGITSFLTDVSSEMVYPLIPLFLTSTLGAGPAVLGIVEGIAESIASLLKLVSGYISDQSGDRKRLTILGYVSSAAGKALLYASTGWGMVLGGRAVDRMGKGIRTAPRDALIVESSREGARGMAFGLHRMLDTAGAAVGVLIAYFVLLHSTTDYAGIFLLSLVPAILGIIVLFFVREKKAMRAGQSRLPRLRWKVLPKRLRAFLIVASLFTLGNSSNTFLLLRATDLNHAALTTLLLYLVYNVIYGITSLPAGNLSDRIGRKRMLVGGYLVYAAVYLGFAVASPGRPWMMWGLFALYGIYSGITDGVEKALIADLAPQDLRATAIGLHATILGAGLFPASVIAGELWQHLGPEYAFAFGAAMGAIAACGLLIALREDTP